MLRTFVGSRVRVGNNKNYFSNVFEQKFESKIFYSNFRSGRQFIIVQFKRCSKKSTPQKVFISYDNAAPPRRKVTVPWPSAQTAFPLMMKPTLSDVRFGNLIINCT